MSQYRSATLDDCLQIKALVDAYIGEDFYPVDDLRNILSDINKNIFVYESDEGKVVGMAYAFIDYFSKASRRLNFTENDCRTIIKLYPYCQQGKIGVFKTICIHPDFRRNHISENLVVCIEEWFNENDVRFAIGEAIIASGGKANARRLNDACGFTTLFNIRKPWSHIKSYCPYCKKDYCQCDAEIFIKEMKR